MVVGGLVSVINWNGSCHTLLDTNIFVFPQFTPYFALTNELLSVDKRTRQSVAKEKAGSTMLFGLLVTTYSQALSHYCTVRELLPAAFPPWAGTFLIIQPGRLLIPLQSPC